VEPRKHSFSFSVCVIEIAFVKPGGTKTVEILYGAKKLTARRQEILDQLPDALSRMTLHKKQVNVTDLAHLTAATGDEFALFTRGSQRLVVRGDANGVPLTVSQLEKLHQQGYRFSAHILRVLPIRPQSWWRKPSMKR